MSAETRAGLWLLGAGLVLGVLGDLLLRSTPLGLGVTVWVGALCAALVLLVRRAPFWTGAPALVFAACVAWRDSPWLISLDVAAIVVAAALGCLQTADARVIRAGVADYVVGLGAALLAAGMGAAILLFDEVRWEELPRGGRAQQFAAVGRGALIALPLLLVFGGLFVAAVWTWIAAGLLRQLGRTHAEPVEVRRPLTIGVTELTVALALLNALFLLFVLVQFRAFVGGHAFVRSHAHVTYASYARQGFFELVAVAALVLPVLLLVDWLSSRVSRWLRALSATLVLLLFAVMASALERMRLYEHRFGLTELRFYTTGFMLWLAVVFVWFLTTVLRGRRERFAVGTLVSGFAAILLVHAVNPDALIARVDARRSQPDVRYLAGLSDDALPTLVRELPRIGRRDRRSLTLLLRDHRHPHDWRSWNLARSRAAGLRGELARTRSR